MCGKGEAIALYTFLLKLLPHHFLSTSGKALYIHHSVKLTIKMIN